MQPPSLTNAHLVEILQERQILAWQRASECKDGGLMASGVRKMEDDFIFLVSIFDLATLRLILPGFEAAGIRHRIQNKSALTNFKVPMSTFIEVEIWVSDKDMDVARRILDDVDRIASPE